MGKSKVLQEVLADLKIGARLFWSLPKNDISMASEFSANLVLKLVKVKVDIKRKIF